MNNLVVNALVTGLVASATCHANPPEQDKPNIVLIFADDLGYTGLSSWGSEYYETPNIDKLAGEGMCFTSGYAGATVCAPSRATLMSGQYTPHTGVYRVTDVQRARGPLEYYEFLQAEKKPFSKDVVTIAETMKKAGYVTGMFGKWHLYPNTPGEQGFDSWIESSGAHFNFKTNPAIDIPEGKYLTDFMTDHAIDFIEEHKGKPFFLYLPDFLVHKPLEAKPEIVEKYKPKEPVGNQKDPVYAAMTESLDHSVGRIYETLDRLNLLENTLIVFTSDNGAPARTRPDGITDTTKGVTDNAPLRDGKGLMYEGGLRVPWIFYWKGKIEPGNSSDIPIHVIDLYPTFAALARAPLPENQKLDGVEIQDLFLGKKDELEKRPLYWYYPNYGPVRMVDKQPSYAYIPTDVIRYGDFKLIEYYHDKTVKLELYNLKNDISERHDLAKEMPEKTHELYKMLTAWKKEVGAEYPVPNPDYIYSNMKK